MSANDAVAAIVAFLVVVATTPLIIQLCRWIGVLDQPGPLKIHARPTPRLGGIAIAIAIAAGMAASKSSPQTHVLAASAFGLVWLTGLKDDLRGLSPLVRLAAQTVSACLLWRAGFGLPVEGGALSLLGAIVIVVLCVNGLNMWDGSDGLAAGIAGIAALAFFFALHQSNMAAALAGSTAAGCAGFLIFNLGGSVFMGDSGSTLLGFVLAFLTLDFYCSHQMTLAVASFPISLIGLPILDAGLAIIRRVRNARSPALGDRYHTYDLLLAQGWSIRSVALTFFAITWLLAALGWLALQTEKPAFIASGALILAGLLVISIRLGALRRAQPQVSSPSFAGEVAARPTSQE